MEEKLFKIIKDRRKLSIIASNLRDISEIYKNKNTKEKMHKYLLGIIELEENEIKK